MSLHDGGSGELEQFCILAKTAKGRACVALIRQVLSNRKIFVFGELLAMPSLQSLRGTEHEPYLSLLELFAYGTYAQYHQRKESLPDIDAAQTQKLRQLTLVTLAQRQEQNVPYAVLFEELSISDVRELEDLIIETIYAGLISGRLDQREGVLRVKGAIGRDVKLEDIDAMGNKLLHWCSSAETLRERLEEKLASFRQSRQEVEEQRTEFQQKLEKAKASVKANPSVGRQAPGMDSSYDDPMDGARKSGRFKRNRMREAAPRNRSK